MKTKKLIFGIGMILCLVLALSVVSATVNVRYTAYQGVIESDNSLTTSTTPVNGYSADVYDCLDAACTSIDLSGPVASATTTTNEIIIPFPTINNTMAYAIYYYTSLGTHIGWQKLGVSGVYGDFPGQVFNATNPIYLSKLRTGSAPIMNLSVVDTAQPNTPIEVNAQISIDSDVYSAINDSRLVNIPLSETVQTEVNLTITNSSGTIIETQTQIVNVPYNGSVDVPFTYNGFTLTGDYNIVVTTNVADSKILNPSTENSNSGITIIPTGLLNYSYSLLQNLQMSPLNPEEGETVDFEINYISSYINESGDFNALGTTLDIEYTRNGLYYGRSIINRNANSSYTSYSWSRSFSQEGDYLVEVTATPISPLGNQTLIATQQMSFDVEDSSGSTTINDDDDDDNDDDDELERLTLNLAGASGDSDGDFIDLTTEKMSKMEIFLWTLFWLIILLILLILLVLFTKFWFLILGIFLLILTLVGILSWLWFLILLLILIILLLIKIYLIN